MYELLPVGAEVRTGYGDPRLEVEQVVEGPVGVSLEFEAAPAFDSQHKILYARVLFPTVFEYRWVAFNQALQLEHPDDVEFALIRIQNSDLVERMLSGV